MMIYYVAEEVWSLWTKESEPTLLRSSVPIAGGDMAEAKKRAEELASKFTLHDFQGDARDPYWWGRNEGDRENCRYVVRAAAPKA
jgi:hypothetical protein